MDSTISRIEDKTGKLIEPPKVTKIAVRQELNSLERAWRRAITIRPPCVPLKENCWTSEFSNNLLQQFFRFTKKKNTDPSSFISNRSEFIAWILYNHSEILREEVDDCIRRMRNDLQISNEKLQSRLGNSQLEAWECHTHIPSLQTENYGAEGFAKKRILVKCVNCKMIITANAPCSNCSGKDIIKGDKTLVWFSNDEEYCDRVQGLKCDCCWIRTEQEEIKACSDCLADGFIGKIYLD